MAPPGFGGRRSTTLQPGLGASSAATNDYAWRQLIRGPRDFAIAEDQSIPSPVSSGSDISSFHLANDDIAELEATIFEAVARNAAVPDSEARDNTEEVESIDSLESISDYDDGHDGTALDDEGGEANGEDQGEDEEDGPEQQPPFDPSAVGLKEISNLASFTVSSYKPGCGVKELRDDDVNQFWQ